MLINKSVEDKLKELGHELHKGSLKEYLNTFGSIPNPEDLERCLIAFEKINDIEDVNEFYFKKNFNLCYGTPYYTVDIVDNRRFPFDVLDHDNYTPVYIRFRTFLVGKVEDQYRVIFDFSGKVAMGLIDHHYRAIKV